MKRALLLLPLLLAGCAALTDWASTPVNDPTLTPLPGGGSVIVTPPPAQEPVTIDLPGGGSAVLTPPGTQAPTTRGEVVGNVVGGLVGAVSGNPLLGVGAVSVIAMLLGMRKKNGGSPA